MARKRKQIYAIILILGGIAFFVDRVFFRDSATTPSSALASPYSVQIEATPSQAVSNASSLLIPAIPFPQNLPPYDPRFSIRDIFAPFPSRPHTDSSRIPADKDRSDIEKDMRPSNSATFMSQHRLDAVLNGKRLKIAIIDGQWFRIGDILDGCKLRKLEGKKAYFTCHDGDAVLNLVITDVTILD